ncbi:DotH/IcmK family type IV secretion protein [Ochrobactrum sp. BTU2]|uniref:DotH/IcmK family type IV secretion protein n=3 Tax=Hyphomicrobiales TaxID=356 RepID=UPI002119D658|nr:DotH/IcmK family type IV secretion protein [Ochrobactrum sp. BTU2]MCQ9147395.1 DotH/IcmK family type IV secretion protein [Ochrobactrum sp. BTU2]
MWRSRTALAALLMASTAGILPVFAQEQEPPAQNGNPTGQETNISAPQGDSAGSPIPRQAPPEETPTTVAPQLQQGQVETTSRPNLPPRQLTKEELDAVRRGMVDQSEGMILRPNEVGRIRDATLGSRSAAVRPTYSTDPYPTALPRVVNAAKTPMQQPPIARLAYGMTTPVTFVDSDGYPWPIVNVTYNPTVLAQDGAGCGASGNTPSGDGQRPTTINLTPCYFEIFSNINVSLEKWPYPIVLMTQSGFRPQQGQGQKQVSIDMPLTVIIEGKSPLADKVKPISISNAKATARRAAAGNYKRPSKVVTGDGDLADYIVGRPPRGARAVALDGAPDLRGYIASNGDLVVVGHAEMLSPGWNSKAQTPDGEKAYRFSGAPYRVLFVDKNGAERPATVRF